MNDFNIDTSNLDAGTEVGIDTDAAFDAVGALEEELEEEVQREELQSQAQSAQPKADSEEKPKARGNDRELPDSDPRSDGVGFNLPDIGAELAAAGLGGVRDTISSVATLPERVGDMLSGEMGREGEDYELDFDPLGGDKNPITKTWWGSMLRGGVHYATLIAGIAAAVKAAPFGVGAAATAKMTALAGSGKKGWLAAQALKGAAGDVVSEYSQEDNALGALKERFPHLDTPLATQDEDSPMMKTFKNVVEGMGIGIVFEGVSMGIKHLAGAAGIRKLQGRKADIEAQKLEMGEEQLKEPGFGAYKNEPIADPWQGSPTSRTSTIMENIEERKRLAKDWGADEEGSMSSMNTPASLKRASDFTKVPTDEIDKIYKEALGNDSYARLMEDLRSRIKDPYTVLEESYAGFRQMVEGRNVTEATTNKEYFEPVLNGLAAEDLPLKNFAEKIVLMDLVNASNAKQIRDYAIGAREIVDVADVFDVDGPMKVIADRLAFGIEQVKTARYLWSIGGQKLRTPEGAEAGAKAFAKKLDKEKMQDFRKQSREAVTAMMQLAQRSPSDNLQKAMLEAFSMSNNIRNLEDLYKYFDSQLRGGEFGRKSSSTIIRELQGVMVHSVLSGPKTPVRAIMGTTTAAFLRPFSQAIGGAVTLDGHMMREGLAAMNAMQQAIPEAFKLFRSRLNSYWSGDISTVKTKNFTFDKREQDWNAIGEMIQMRKDMGKPVSPGTEAAYLIANMARAANNSNLLTYSTKLMAATDDAFGFIMARARSRQLAMRQALENNKVGQVTNVTPKLLKEYEDRFYANFLDKDGMVDFDSDAALKFAKEEGTLTRDLSGFAKGLDQLMGKTPWAKPFMLFARTGVNGLELTMKHMPGFNRLVADERKILNATMEQADAGELFDIGISSGQDLLQAKAIQRGRQAIGTGIITMAAMHFMNGGLSGNGPQDRRQRQLWIDAGWQPRSIKIGDTWVSYDAFEPFNSILSFVADIGDHYELMGPEWAEKNLFKTSLVLAQGVANKSYMAGLQQFVDLLSAQPGQGEKIIASLVNNQVPLSSLRNELGKLFNPYMKELNAGFTDNIRNRNQLTEAFASDPLPVKYDILTGEPIKNHDFVTRMFNMFSPVQMNTDYSPGKALLFNSGYDMRVSAYSSPDGVSMKDSPEVRSLYQEALGKQNLQAQLDKLAESEDMQQSIADMERDRNSGLYGKDPTKEYHHNLVIGNLMRRAQSRAWASIQNDPRVQQLVEADRLRKSSAAATRAGQHERARSTYNQAQEVLNMPIR